MKKTLIYTIVLLGLVTVSFTSAHAGLLWQQVAEVPTVSTYRVFAQHDTLYSGSGPLVYRFDLSANKWDTLAQIDPAITLISAITKVGNRLFVGSFNHGVFESTNNGASWTPRNAGLTNQSALAIVDFAVRGDSLYVGTSGAGVYVMNLKGPSTWIPYAVGMPDNIASNVLSMYDFDNYLLAGAGLNSDVYRNAPDTDGWNEYPFATFDPRGAGMQDITSLGDVVYAATGNDLYISRDSGATWERGFVTNRLIAAGSVAADQSIVYASIWLPQFGSYYFASSGADWELVDSVPVALTINLEVMGGRLYAGRGDGLWYAELSPTDVGEGGGALPEISELAQNYPNPFNPTTTIAYSVPRRSSVSLEVFNLLGQSIRTLVEEVQSAGEHQVVWDGTDSEGEAVSSGVYFYRLTTDGYTSHRKMLLVK